MMYLDKMVVCLKVGGKILREHRDEVYIPFGSEYSILIKNLNSVRASVDLQIDGNPVFADGQKLIVEANSNTEIERFVVSNSAGNRFRFIERTPQIEEHKGIGSEDGLIRVAFKYAKPVPVPRSSFRRFGSDSSIYGATSFKSMSKPTGYSEAHLDCSYADVASASSAPQSDVGITVAGSISTQKFQEVAAFALEDEEHVLVLRVAGDVGQNVRQSKPAFVIEQTSVCPSCGTSAAKSAKFCSQCSTSLEQVA